MLKRMFIAIILCLGSQVLQAQVLQDMNYYYNHPLVSQDAKDYYARLFSVNNSERVYSIIDSAYTENADTRPFYVYLISRMLPEATGDLRNELNIMCRQLAEQQPGTVTGVLFSKMVTESTRQLWAERVAVDIRLGCEADPLTCFKSSRNTALQNCDAYNKGQLEIVYNMVRKDMKLYEQR